MATPQRPLPPRHELPLRPAPAARPELPPRPSAARRELPPRPAPASRPAVPSGVTPPTGPGAAARPARPVRSRPDATGLRVALGFGGVAAASALVTTFLAPVPPTPPVAAVALTSDTAAATPQVRYVQLLPGQTPPPNAAVAQVPTATPRVVTVTTRQSGTKK
jgi:hypothetical protein